MFLFSFFVTILMYIEYRVERNGTFMEELKYLKSAYEQASGGLKDHPAFVEKLKEIEGMVSMAEQGQDYHYTSHDVQVENDTVQVFLGTSYGDGIDKVYSENLRQRSGRCYSITLDQENNLKFESTMVGVRNDPYSNNSYINFGYDGELIKKDSQEVIFKRKTGNLIEDEICWGESLVPGYQKRPEELSEEEYQQRIADRFKLNDNGLKDMATNVFFMQKYGNWYDWNATRDPNNSKQAWCHEDIILGNSRLPLFNTAANVVGPYYDHMRIDSFLDIANNKNLGGPQSFTVEGAKETLEATGYYNFSGGYGRH